MAEKINKLVIILALTLLNITISTNGLDLLKSRSLNVNFCIENVGCFDHLGSFPIISVKELKLTVNVSICLITRGNNYDNAEQLNKFENIANSTFNSSRETKFIIPGWQSNKNVSWIREMVREFLIKDDYNVFVVNWADYLVNVIYSIAAADTRVVGDRVGEFIQQLQDTYDYPLEKIHMIGFSLGAHICGFVGTRLRGKIGRITGLDPAGPLFDGNDSEDKLDSVDALFVDVIHSNAGPIFKKHLGIDEPIGHIDFYPNGGWTQPNCEPIKDVIWSIITTLAIDKIKNIMEILGCNHNMAVVYYIESINNECRFESQQCFDFNAFMNDQCGGNCGDDEDQTACIPMGFPAEWRIPTAKANQRFFLKTSSVKPHCQSSIVSSTTSVPNFINNLQTIFRPKNNLSRLFKKFLHHA